VESRELYIDSFLFQTKCAPTSSTQHDRPCHEHLRYASAMCQIGLSVNHYYN